MDDIINNKFYFVFLGILIFIVVTNYKNSNNPRLVKSESNWINGNAYWNSACIKLEL